MYVFKWKFGGHTNFAVQLATMAMPCSHHSSSSAAGFAGAHGHISGSASPNVSTTTKTSVTTTTCDNCGATTRSSIKTERTDSGQSNRKQLTGNGK